MRICSHLLPIETERYRTIPRDERNCPFGGSSIGDECHYLMKCNHSLFSHLRAVFLERLFTLNSCFIYLSGMSLFIYIYINIMTMCDENIITLNAHYIDNILNCYKAVCDQK